jgi:molecular chaperone GrpE
MSVDKEQLERADQASESGQDPGALDAEDLRQQLATLQEQGEQHRNDYLRAVAEMDNIRKRAQRDVEAAHRFGIERFAADLLEVRDSLELGIAAGGAGAGGPLLEGMEATLRQLDKAFEKAGITVVDPLGQPFDPEFHEAMTTQESPDQPPGTVLNVFQKGYLLNGRLLRPARVVIARES